MLDQVFLLLDFQLGPLLRRQEHAAFDHHERGGHHEKLAGDLKVELAHQVNVGDELRGEFGEVDLVNVHLLLFDEIKEQVERAFKDLELNFVFRHERGKSKSAARGLQWRKLDSRRLGN